MPNKPTTVPQLDTNQTNRTIPAPSKVTDGYLTDDIFPAANANYLHGWAGDWLGWLDGTFDDGATPGDLKVLGDLEVAGLYVNAGTAQFDGWVGIGVAIPTSPLHVWVNSNITPSSSGDGYIEMQGAGYVGYLTMDGSALYVGQNSAGRALGLQTNATTRMWVSGAGLVGIGNAFTSPDTTLHVWESDVRAPAAGTVLTIEKNDSVVVSLLSSNAAGKLAGFWFGDATQEGAGRFEYLHDVDRMDWWTANARHMALMDDGDLAIGANFVDPDSKLHVWVGNAGADPVAGTVITAESNADAYVSVMTPAANVGGLVCGDPGDADAGRWLYRHSDTLPGWALHSEAKLALKVDSEQRMHLGVGEDHTAAFSGATPFANRKTINLYGDTTGGAHRETGIWMYNGGNEYAFYLDTNDDIFIEQVDTGTIVLKSDGSDVQIGDSGGTDLVGIGFLPTTSTYGRFQINLSTANLGFVDSTSTGGTTTAGYITVNIGGTVRYIRLESTS